MEDTRARNDSSFIGDPVNYVYNPLYHQRSDPKSLEYSTLARSSDRNLPPPRGSSSFPLSLDYSSSTQSPRLSSSSPLSLDYSSSTQFPKLSSSIPLSLDYSASVQSPKASPRASAGSPASGDLPLKSLKIIPLNEGSSAPAPETSSRSIGPRGASPAPETSSLGASQVPRSLDYSASVQSPEASPRISVVINEPAASPVSGDVPMMQLIPLKDSSSAPGAAAVSQPVAAAAAAAAAGVQPNVGAQPGVPTAVPAERKLGFTSLSESVQAPQAPSRLGDPPAPSVTKTLARGQSDAISYSESTGTSGSTDTTSSVGTSGSSVSAERPWWNRFGLGARPTPDVDVAQGLYRPDIGAYPGKDAARPGLYTGVAADAYQPGVYSPGAAAGDLYRPAGAAADLYRPAVDAYSPAAYSPGAAAYSPGAAAYSPGAAPAYSPAAYSPGAMGAVAPAAMGAAAIGASEPSKFSLVAGLGIVLLIVLLILVMYYFYHWFSAKRESRQYQAVQAQQEAHQAGKEAGKKETQAQLDVLKAQQQQQQTQVGPYGPDLPVATEEGTDTHPNCAAWAANDECWINPSFMLYKCQKSCKTGGLTIPQTDQIRDSNLKKCQDWGDCSQVNCSNWYHALRCRRSCLRGQCAP